METSFVNEYPCGCSGSGLSGGTSATQSGCGCSGGLGEAQAPETQKDLINEAKKYINSEIPTPIKVVGGLAALGLLLIATRGKK
ncbi:hypothetical protein CK503_08535 [Aliifodinibius salipaludis]|jgi:hypothetical protein|uniref:Uncharacterized protein n=1 Tax=Fodinibius salipaludis TaxID=2032627 RepID=A0A2A2GAP7_9BACT|nr:hypothetical protein [Aliifodinibius salipaludis]PAU94250.1 hypothetical protein CK503_08535 [Aliifodinibius salipaludis]